MGSALIVDRAGWCCRQTSQALEEDLLVAFGIQSMFYEHGSQGGNRIRFQWPWIVISRGVVAIVLRVVFLHVVRVGVVLGHIWCTLQCLRVTWWCGVAACYEWIVMLCSRGWGGVVGGTGSARMWSVSHPQRIVDRRGVECGVWTLHSGPTAECGVWTTHSGVWSVCVCVCVCVCWCVWDVCVCVCVDACGCACVRVCA